MKNVSKKKRHTRNFRLRASADWIKNYEGKNIVKGYSKWFGLDLLFAIKELRRNGVEIKEDYENNIRQIQEAKQIAKQKKKEEKELEIQDEFSNAQFAFIAGYTSGGAPYGLTHEEMKYLNEKKN